MLVCIWILNVMQFDVVHSSSSLSQSPKCFAASSFNTKHIFPCNLGKFSSSFCSVSVVCTSSKMYLSTKQPIRFNGRFLLFHTNLTYQRQTGLDWLLSDWRNPCRLHPPPSPTTTPPLINPHPSSPLSPHPTGPTPTFCSCSAVQQPSSSNWSSK